MELYRDIISKLRDFGVKFQIGTTSISKPEVDFTLRSSSRVMMFVLKYTSTKLR